MNGQNLEEKCYAVSNIFWGNLSWWGKKQNKKAGAPYSSEKENLFDIRNYIEKETSRKIKKDCIERMEKKYYLINNAYLHTNVYTVLKQ